MCRGRVTSPVQFRFYFKQSPSKLAVSFNFAIEIPTFLKREWVHYPRAGKVKSKLEVARVPIVNEIRSPGAYIEQGTIHSIMAIVQ